MGEPIAYVHSARPAQPLRRRGRTGPTSYRSKAVTKAQASASTEEYDLPFFSQHGKERAVAWGTYQECLGIIADTIEEDEGWL